MRGKNKNQLWEMWHGANGRLAVSETVKKKKHLRDHKWMGPTILTSVESWHRVTNHHQFLGIVRNDHVPPLDRYLDSLYSEPLPKHDVVPEGSVDV